MNGEGYEDESAQTSATTTRAGRSPTGRVRRSAVLWLLGATLVAVSSAAPALEIQGHRGARGLWPENSLAGFEAALRIGVDVLELDLALTADDIVVVSHDRLLNPAIARGPGGQWLPAAGPAIRSLPYEALSRYDVGRLQPDSRYAARFPHQQAVDGSRIPKLTEVFDLVRRAKATVMLNVELKSRPHGTSEYPQVAHFAARVVETVRAANMSERVSVQSFHWSALAEVKRLAPELPLVALTAQRGWLDNIQAQRPGPSHWTAGLDVDEHGGSVPHLVAALGAPVWSPFWRDLDAAAVRDAHALGLKVVVWTVNEPADIERMIALGVDGIISDYPDRLRGAFERAGHLVPQAFEVPK